MKTFFRFHCDFFKTKQKLIFVDRYLCLRLYKTWISSKRNQNKQKKWWIRNNIFICKICVMFVHRLHFLCIIFTKFSFLFASISFSLCTTFSHIPLQCILNMLVYAFIYFPIRWSIIRLFQYFFCSSYRKNLWFVVFHKYCNWFNHKWMDPQGNIDIVMENRVFRLKLHDKKKHVSWTGKFNMCNDCMRRKLLK